MWYSYQPQRKYDITNCAHVLNDPTAEELEKVKVVA